MSITVGLSGLAVYLPPFKVDLQSWCSWTNNSWDKIRNLVGESFRLPGPHENVYTLAANAALQLILNYQLNPQDIGFLALGTESSTDNAAGAVIVKGLLEQALAALRLPPLNPHVEVPEYKHACLGGIYALKGALRYLSCEGAKEQAIVISADIATYARGSSGEPTQGSGAVAMLLTTEPTLGSIDLQQTGKASTYRIADFRKPRGASGHDQIPQLGLDFPIFNGKYSTWCYIDTVGKALNNLLAKNDQHLLTLLEQTAYILCHRPYHKLPLQALSTLYLQALTQDLETHAQELQSYAPQLTLRQIVDELQQPLPPLGEVHPVATLKELLKTEPFKKRAELVKNFLQSKRAETLILSKLTLGQEALLQLGNLYTASLPAWLASAFSAAALQEISLSHQQLLLCGYGSGDAAEILLLKVQPTWRAAAEKINLPTILKKPARLLTPELYAALHDDTGLDLATLNYQPQQEFMITQVGQEYSAEFADLGIDYYRYVP